MTPMEETAERLARSSAVNPFLNEKRFAIQVWKDGRRQDFHAAEFAVAELLVGKFINPDDQGRADTVTIYDNRKCLRVRDWRKAWFGYSRRGIGADA